MRASLKLTGGPWKDVKCGDYGFHETRSGRVFSEIHAPTFCIATSVLTAAQDIEAGQCEDLAELDSGPPSFAPPPSPPASTSATHATSPATISTAAPASARKTRDKVRSKAKRSESRAAAKANFDILLAPRPRHPRHLLKASKPIKAKFELRKIRIAATGWISLRDDGVAPEERLAGKENWGSTPTHRLCDFVGPAAIFPGFTVVKSRGPEARPIVDSLGKVCGVYAGRPDDDDFMEKVHDPAVEAMEAARAAASLAEERTFHRRGNWGMLTAGDSHGGGQVQPGALVNGIINTAILCSLLSNLAFIRLAGFATGVFANWAPDLFDFYIDYMGDFYRKYTHLKRPFLNSIWSACTFNLGPHTCALGHRDYANLAFGWCAITALGTFDYTKGGHLILWDCKLVLEFPPGTTILIPSAAIFHSNIPISDSERRYSFTQYTAGGLFRWVEHGFQSEAEYMATLSPAELEQERQLGLERAVEGAGLFSTLAELKAMAAL